MDKVSVVLLDAGQRQGTRPVTDATFSRAVFHKEIADPVKALCKCNLIHKVIVVVRSNGSRNAEEVKKENIDQEPPPHGTTPTTRELVKEFGSGWNGRIDSLVPMPHWWSMPEVVDSYVFTFAKDAGANKVIFVERGASIPTCDDIRRMAPSIAEDKPHRLYPESVH
jgi:hypothetical protein